MSEDERPTRYVALLYKPGRRSQAEAIQADRIEIQGEGLQLYRDDRLVWRERMHDLEDAVGFSDQRPCKDRCREHRERLAGAGAGTIHLQEGGTAPRRHLNRPRGGRTAIPAEGIRFVMEPDESKPKSP